MIIKKLSKQLPRLRVNQLRINPSYQKLVPPLTNEEFNSLRDSIKKYGQWHKITTNSDRIILDGNNRYRACLDLNITPQTEVITFSDKLHEQLYVIENAARRRHLNTFQKVTLALKLKPILQQIAKGNSAANLPNGKMRTAHPSVRIQALGRVDEQIGKAAKTSHDTVRQVEYILKKANPNIIEKLNAGTKSIYEVYKNLHNSEIRQKLINF